MTRDILTKSPAQAVREVKDAVVLGNRLFFDRRGPIELYPSGPYENKQLRTSSSGDAVDPDNPATLVLDLEGTLGGCQWLLSAWKSLRDVLEAGLGWQSHQKIKAIRLLGKQPISALDDHTVALVFLASHAIEPEYSYAFQELRSEIHEDRFNRIKSRLDRWSQRGIAPADATEARAMLLRIVDEVTARLRVLESLHQKVADRLSVLQNDILSFDESKTGEQVRRHMGNCNRLLLRNVDAVRKGRRDEAQGWGRTRKERELRKERGSLETERGIVTNDGDDRLVLDEKGTVYTAGVYVQEGLARYDAALGYGTPRARRRVVNDVIPHVPDYARWVAEEEKRKAEDGGRTSTSSVESRAEDEDGTELGFGNGSLGVGRDKGAPLMITEEGERANVQNEIGDGDGRAEETCGRADCGDPMGALDARRTESDAEPGFGTAGTGVERGESVPLMLTEGGERASTQNEIGESEQRSQGDASGAAERHEERSHAGALEGGEVTAEKEQRPQNDVIGGRRCDDDDGMHSRI